MSVPDSRRGPGRAVVVPLLALVALCSLLYGYGLTSHGLTNWQEGQRALVAREMYRSGEWIVPTAHGLPYIAKPPMMYWVAMMIGHARAALGFEPFAGEHEVRLTVALAGILGVVATYLVGRRMLAPEAPDDEELRIARSAAWWAALGLATGILYFRSARIGELDILMAPFIVVAIGAMDAAARFAERTTRVHWWAVVIGALAATGAALTKGPPALLVIGLAGYGPAVMRAVAAAGPAGRARRAGGAIVGAAALVGLSAGDVDSTSGALGLLCFGALGAALGAWTARLLKAQALRNAFVILSRTHPVFTLGLPLLTLWGWGKLVAMRVGGTVVDDLVAAELDDNLRVLVLESPVKNLGFLAYGVAPISVAAIAGVIWLIQTRPTFRNTMGRWTPFVWCGLSFAVFSLLGKGVARYLTPVWPAVALIGGLWLATAVHDRSRTQRASRGIAGVALAVLLAAGIGQMWWYGQGRQEYAGARSPREFVQELRPHAPARIGTYEMRLPALEYYFDAPVVRWEREPRRGALGVDHLVSTVQEGETLLIARGESDAVVRRYGSIVTQLEAAGVTVREIAPESSFVWLADEAPVTAYRLTMTRER